MNCSARSVQGTLRSFYLSANPLLAVSKARVPLMKGREAAAPLKSIFQPWSRLATLHAVLSVPQFGMMPEVLKKSDYVSTLPAGLLAGFADFVVVFALPVQAPQLVIAWHPRNHAEPGLEWSRELTAGAAGISSRGSALRA